MNNDVLLFLLILSGLSLFGLLYSGYIKKSNDKTQREKLIDYLLLKGVKDDLAIKILDFVMLYSETFKIDPVFVIALIEKESSFNPRAAGDEASDYYSELLGLLMRPTSFGLGQINTKKTSPVVWNTFDLIIMNFDYPLFLPYKDSAKRDEEVLKASQGEDSVLFDVKFNIALICAYLRFIKDYRRSMYGEEVNEPGMLYYYYRCGHDADRFRRDEYVERFEEIFYNLLHEVS